MTAVALEPCLVCPKGIRNCAHLGDRVVWLVSSRNTKPNICLWPWQVQGPIPLPKGAYVHLIGGLHTSSLAKAEAEFTRREALLRSEA